MLAGAFVRNQCSGGGAGSFCNDEALEALSQLRVSIIGGATLGDARSISTETNPWPHIWWKSLPIRGLFPVGWLFDTQKNRVV